MDKVTNNFDKVIVLINSSAPMEMGFIENPKISAAMYIGYPGYYGAMAIPEILAGNVTPSGHLTDTCAYDLSSSPTYVNSGPDATIVYGGKGGRYKDYAEGIYSDISGMKLPMQKDILITKKEKYMALQKLDMML